MSEVHMASVHRVLCPQAGPSFLAQRWSTPYPKALVLLGCLKPVALGGGQAYRRTFLPMVRGSCMAPGSIHHSQSWFSVSLNTPSVVLTCKKPLG